MGAMGGDFPKASIGNYKGVMLCNRPNEFGKKVPERSGNIPFNSRVNPLEPIGWNPTAKLQPRANKKRSKLSILNKVLMNLLIFQRTQTAYFSNTKSSYKILNRKRISKEKKPLLNVNWKSKR